MTPEYTNQLATELLLASLIGVLAIGILVAFAVVLYTRRSRAGTVEKDACESAQVLLPKYHPTVFEHSCRWLAVKSTHIAAVQTALDLHNPVPCSWGEGVSRLREGQLFVAPPVRGWIVVVGHGLPDPSDDIDRCFHFVSRLSRALGHVHFYSTDRALNHHAWVRAEAGQVRRAYAWAGQTLWNQGHPTLAEAELQLRCYEYGEGAGAGSLPCEEGAASNAEKVIALAARWSLDPTSIAEGAPQAALGIAGELAPSQRH